MALLDGCDTSNPNVDRGSLVPKSRLASGQSHGTSARLARTEANTMCERDLSEGRCPQTG